MFSKRILAAAAATCMAASAGAAPAAPARGDVAEACDRLYVGTHQQGGMPSLFTSTFDARDGSFGTAAAVASIERPTWLVKDAERPLLYAVSETGNDGAAHGAVAGLRIASAGGTLDEIGRVDSGGGGPTHLALDAGSNTLFVANYGTGHVAALELGAEGAPAGAVSVVRDEGNGPSPRQRGPHAHGVTIDPSRRYVLVPDLGADRVFVYRFDPAARKLAPAATPFVQLPPGTGPRHLVFAPDGRTAYLLAELTGDLHAYAWDAARGTLRAVQTLSTLSQGYKGKISAGEIVVAADGGHVYVSNRGDDTIIAFRSEAGTGRLAEVQRIAAGGTQPWNLALSPDGRWLLAANETSNALASFRVGDDGRLTATANRLDVPKPVSMVFAHSCVAH